MKITYWIITGLVAVALLMGGVMDLMHNEQVADAMGKLGYPAYVMTILGVAKVLGVIALLVPKFPAIKEWAYAGFVFDLVGAIWSHVAVGDAAGSAAPVIILSLLLVSYVLYRKLQANPSTAITA